MSKKDLDKIMAERSPLSRSVVTPVDPYIPPTPAVDDSLPTHTHPNTGEEDKSETTNRTVVSNERTVRANGLTERSKRTVESSSVLSELTQGIEEDKRPTERYSFEIFTDQKQRIEDLQYQYKRKTGKRLSSSRILRESLEEYLEKALKALR